MNMESDKFPLQIANADQIGIVVFDLDETIRQYQFILGIDNFEIIEWPIPGKDPQATYYDKPAYYTMKIGFAQIGNIQLEIVQPLKGESIFKDFLMKHGPGLHHIRFSEKDFDAKVDQLQKAGIKMIASGSGVRSTSTWAYFDTTKLLGGIYIEIRSV
jgi:hypothetical protein